MGANESLGPTKEWLWTARKVPHTLIEFLPAEFFANEFVAGEEVIQCNMVSVEKYEDDTYVDKITFFFD